MIVARIVLIVLGIGFVVRGGLAIYARSRVAGSTGVLALLGPLFLLGAGIVCLGVGALAT